MMNDSITIEKDTAEIIFELAKKPIPENIDDFSIKDALISIKMQLDSKGSGSGDLAPDYSQYFTVEPEPQEGETQEDYSDEQWQKDLAKAGFGEKRKILVVDDIGVVTYQLKALFQKAGYDVETAKDIYTAIKLIRKQTFSFIVMDLFVSTEREGFLLLDETKKIVVSQKLNTKIVVVTASNKGEHKVKCMNRGANMFLQKDLGWQDTLLGYVEEN